MLDIKNIKKYSMSLPQAIAFFVVAAILLTRFQTFVTNGGLYFVKASLSVEWRPIILVYNMLPIFIALCLVYFLSGSVGISFSSVSIVFLIMLLVNHFKVEFRAEPFIPTDVTTLGEATNVSSGLDFKFSWLIIAAILIVILLNVIMWLFVRSRKEKIYLRLIGLAVTAVLAITSYTGIYSDVNYFKNLHSFANVWKDISVMQNKGFMYMFMTRFALFKYDMPDGYSKDAVDAVYDEYEPMENLPEGYIMPDVIAIMGESFFDVKRTNLKYPDGVNPTANIERLRKDGIYGNLIVRGIGGGTVISEFEFLTANALPFITDTIISPYNTYISKNAYSIPVHLKENFNYYTNAMHLGNEWFYNRRSTYPRLGFNETTFYEDIAHTNPQKAYNGYTADSVLTDLIVNKYNEHVKNNPEQSYFNFNVTIENHLPYNESYANEEYIIRPEGMSDSDYFMVNQYVEKVKKTDDLLGAVADCLEASSRPAIVVFYGDHLPNFNQKTNDVLPQLGISTGESGFEGDKLTHMTPYVIWGNTAYKKQMEKYNFEINVGEQEIISSNYLGIKMLEYMKAPMSEHYKFIKDVKKEFPVITPYYYVNEEGEQIDKPDSKQQEMIDKYKIIQYYSILKYKGH